MKTEGYPAHETNMKHMGAIQPMQTQGYPTHEKRWLSSPWKLRAIQPMKTEGYPAHALVPKDFFGSTLYPYLFTWQVLSLSRL